MPTWKEIDLEISDIGSPDACDQVRTNYLAELGTQLGRNVIAYYSGWLQPFASGAGPHPETAITDNDMNGFMAAVHGLPHERGLDLILHTPGGGVEATGALVEYLYSKFDSDIRVIVPHLAMSAGTMIVCAGKEVLMAKHSSLGPTDPQVYGVAALGVLSEIEKALKEIKGDPSKKFIYRHIFQNYPPTLITACERSVEGTRDLIKKWLKENMFKNEDDPGKRASETVKKLMDYHGTRDHSHHFPIKKCEEMGLNVVAIEDDQELQDSILSVHHAFIITFAKTPAIKIIQNNLGEIWSISSSEF